jgi:hypothetical protein
MAVARRYSDKSQKHKKHEAERIEGDEMNRSTQGLADVLYIQECLSLFVSRHPQQGFPENLEALGPKGSNRLDEQLAHGEKDTFHFRYEIGIPGASNRHRKYSLVAVTDPPFRYAESGRYFTDETEVVRPNLSKNNYQNVSNAESQPIDPNPTGEIRWLDRCIHSFTDGYAPSLASVEEQSGWRCSSSPAQQRLIPQALVNELHYMGYIYLYSPGKPNHAGEILKYSIQASPLAYGRPYKLSFYCDQDHWCTQTNEPRHAQPSDKTASIFR